MMAYWLCIFSCSDNWDDIKDEIKRSNILQVRKTITNNIGDAMVDVVVVVYGLKY